MGVAWEWPGNGFMRLATRARSGSPTAPGRKVGGHYLWGVPARMPACRPAHSPTVISRTCRASASRHPAARQCPCQRVSPSRAASAADCRCAVSAGQLQVLCIIMILTYCRWPNPLTAGLAAAGGSTSPRRRRRRRRRPSSACLQHPAAGWCEQQQRRRQQQWRQQQRCRADI